MPSELESEAFEIALEKNPVISIRVIPGHFATGTHHLSHYLDINRLKTDAVVAQDVAREMAIPYLSSTTVDTIVCMERTTVIGAYLAEELLEPGNMSVNGGGKIHVIAPLLSSEGKLFFPDSSRKLLADQDILLLVTSISSGRTVNNALECLEYYGGMVRGISALFVKSQHSQGINALFTEEDIPGYTVYRPAECEMCRAGRKLDAVIGMEGYTIIK